ncbi:hypothetical protein ADUPG1_009078 [Aduncisulcus paluster]|uniref:Uncharacterized protein n=1 Tax=Aduncisulcus paluster TaxID=2918883 RepID=A0ABQ5KWL9_9EUKA|nr:hypothetical protein ADUPG1_009078 [Aduncisulcus paluster]
MNFFDLFYFILEKSFLSLSQPSKKIPSLSESVVIILTFLRFPYFVTKIHFKSSKSSLSSTKDYHIFILFWLIDNLLAFDTTKRKLFEEFHQGIEKRKKELLSDESKITEDLDFTVETYAYLRNVVYRLQEMSGPIKSKGSYDQIASIIAELPKGDYDRFQEEYTKVIFRSQQMDMVENAGDGEIREENEAERHKTELSVKFESGKAELDAIVREIEFVRSKQVEADERLASIHKNEEMVRARDEIDFEKRREYQDKLQQLKEEIEAEKEHKDRESIELSRLINEMKGFQEKYNDKIRSLKQTKDHLIELTINDKGTSVKTILGSRYYECLDQITALKTATRAQTMFQKSVFYRTKDLKKTLTKMMPAIESRTRKLQDSVSMVQLPFKLDLCDEEDKVKELQNIIEQTESKLKSAKIEKEALVEELEFQKEQKKRKSRENLEKIQRLEKKRVDLEVEKAEKRREMMIIREKAKKLCSSIDKIIQKRKHDGK